MAYPASLHTVQTHPFFYKPYTPKTHYSQTGKPPDFTRKQRMHREENQLDATERFTALIICSTCFGHLYARHQELQTILALLPHMVCNALVAGGRRSGAGQQAMCPG